MILTISKHGRSSRDCEFLATHLEKPENEFVKIAEIGNSAATDLRGVLADMQITRNASPQAKACLMHISINPARNHSEAALIKEAHRARLEFDKGERPYIILIHGKPRVNSSEGGRNFAEGSSNSAEGGSDTHAHLVIGMCNSAGKSLSDSMSIIRGEVCARLGEFELNEPATPSRHTPAVLKKLRERNLHEVASWLTAAHGETPEKPVSAISAATRQRAKRNGINLPLAKSEIVAAWQRTGDISGFKIELSKHGYAIEKGQKPHVWLIRDSAAELDLGAADRLLRIKRRQFHKMMEPAGEQGQSFIQPRGLSADGRPRQEIVGAGAINRRETDIAAAVTVAAGRGPVAAGSDRLHREVAGGTHSGTTQPARGNGADRLKDRYSYRKLERLRALRILAAAGGHLARMSNFTPTGFGHELGPDPLPLIWGLTDMWGIPIPPPRPRF